LQCSVQVEYSKTNSGKYVYFIYFLTLSSSKSNLSESIRWKKSKSNQELGNIPYQPGTITHRDRREVSEVNDRNRPRLYRLFSLPMEKNLQKVFVHWFLRRRKLENIYIIIFSKMLFSHKKEHATHLWFPPEHTRC
jgi:hypothetical protein